MRAISVVAALGALLTSPAAFADVSCKLTKPLKQSVKGAWQSLERGADVVVKDRGPEWSLVESSFGAGRVATAVLEAACPASMTIPIEGTATPAAASAGATPTPPVPAVVALPAAAATTQAPAAEAAPAAPLEREQHVAVLDLKASAGLDALADALTSMAVAELAALDGYRAVSRNELKSVLVHKADAAMLGCETVACIGGVGKLVDAQLVLTGSIDKVGEAHVLSFSLVDPAVPAVLERTEAAWRGTPDGMLPLVRPMIARLIAGPNAASHLGAVDVLTEEGARVVVDGKEVGAAPLGAPITGLASGVHRVQVEKDGALPHDADVIVTRNETTIARVVLEEIPFTQQPWFWITTVGTGLLAAGTTTGIVVYALATAQQPTRVVLAPKP